MWILVYTRVYGRRDVVEVVLPRGGVEQDRDNFGIFYLVLEEKPTIQRVLDTSFRVVTGLCM